MKRWTSTTTCVDDRAMALQRRSGCVGLDSDGTRGSSSLRAHACSCWAVASPICGRMSTVDLVLASPCLPKGGVLTPTQHGGGQPQCPNGHLINDYYCINTPRTCKGWSCNNRDLVSVCIYSLSCECLEQDPTGEHNAAFEIESEPIVK